MAGVIADPEKLKQLAKTLNSSADQLHQIARNLTRALDSSGWDDAERQRFEQEFRHSIEGVHSNRRAAEEPVRARPAEEGGGAEAIQEGPLIVVTPVRTREEALALVASALSTFDEQVGAVLTQATAVASGALQQAGDAVQRWRARSVRVGGRAGRGQTGRAAARPGGARRAREQLNQARRAYRRVADVSGCARTLQRSYAQQCSPILAAARRHLAGRVTAVEQYLGGRGGGASGNTPAGADGWSWRVLAGLGMTSVSVSAADLGDMPAQVGFNRGGLSRGDYRWAVQTWNDTVGPGIARGMTREDFEARDNRKPCAPPLRRTADVYDLFLGPDAIRADRRPDGSLNIGNGRHRLQIARELGIKDLPGRVFG